METPDWARLPGALLAGGYEVEQCLQAGETSARFKVRVLGDRFTTAVGEFFLPQAVPAGQVEVWTAASRLRHQNVSAPLTAGLHQLGHHALSYFVEVQPDETLAGVMAERALTPEEAREVVRSMVEGFEYLHANGFVQFKTEPASVAAIAERICLRMEGARLTNAPLATGEDASMDHDVAGLGETVYAVLKQKKIEGDIAVATEGLTSPFDFLVQKCLEPDLQKRCSLPAVRSILKGELVPVKKVEPSDARLVVEPLTTPRASAEKPIVAEPVERPVVAATPVTPAKAAIAPASPQTPELERPASAARPNPAPVSTQLPPLETFERPSERARVNWLIYVPVAALLVAALLLWVMRPSKKATVPAATTTWPSHEVEPAPNAARASSTPPSATPVPPSTTTASVKGGEIWRVVAFTFNREADAAKRAKAIDEKHPVLHAEVFSPNGHSPYLVVLGGQMSREQAEQMRRKARVSGLPRDTYVQNYSR